MIKNIFEFVTCLIIIISMVACMLATVFGAFEVLWWVFTGDFFHILHLGSGGKF